MRLARPIIVLGFLFPGGWPAMSAQSPGLDVSPLTGQVHVYTTWQDFGGHPFPSNSLYVLTDSGAVLIDTPWDTDARSPSMIIMDQEGISPGLPTPTCETDIVRSLIRTSQLLLDRRIKLVFQRPVMGWKKTQAHASQQEGLVVSLVAWRYV